VTRPWELFAVIATKLLVLSFLSRFLPSPTGTSISLGRVGYLLSPSTVSLVAASFLCFCCRDLFSLAFAHEP
jgi:hypothetical protein